MGDDLSSKETKIMARYTNNSKKRTTKNGKSNKKKTSTASQLKKLAYQMGQVNKGLKNPNTQVYESYHRGLSKDSSEKKKPLY